MSSSTRRRGEALGRVRLIAHDVAHERLRNPRSRRHMLIWSAVGPLPSRAPARSGRPCRRQGRPLSWRGHQLQCAHARLPVFKCDVKHGLLWPMSAKWLQTVFVMEFPVGLCAPAPDTRISALERVRFVVPKQGMSDNKYLHARDAAPDLHARARQPSKSKTAVQTAGDAEQPFWRAHAQPLCKAVCLDLGDPARARRGQPASLGTNESGGDRGRVSAVSCSGMEWNGGTRDLRHSGRMSYCSVARTASPEVQHGLGAAGAEGLCLGQQRAVFSE